MIDKYNYIVIIMIMRVHNVRAGAFFHKQISSKPAASLKRR